jgi:hypothetical protein
LGAGPPRQSTDPPPHRRRPPFATLVGDGFAEAEWAPERIPASFRPNRIEAKAIPGPGREPLRYGPLGCKMPNNHKKQTKRNYY